MNVNLVPILFMEKLYFHVISFTQAVKKSVKLNVLKKWCIYLNRQKVESIFDKSNCSLNQK